MSLYHVWAQIAGYLIVLVRGPALERLLNLASANGIYLWEIRRYRPDLVVMRIGVRGFKALRPLLRQTHCRAWIRRRRGWPFLWRRLIRRPGFLCGFFLFVTILFFLASFVWRVELIGVKRLSRPVLLASLRRLGLYAGVFRGRLDKDRIQREMELATPEAAWIGVEIRGMVAVVRIVERVSPPGPKKAGDLIAARDGLVTKVVVYRGTPAVTEGETVRSGQLLVRGMEVTIGPGGSLHPHPLAASGRVEARVWDEVRILVPLAYWRPTITGRRATVIRLRLGRWTLSLGPMGGPPFRWFQQSRYRRGLGHGRNTLPLVELVIDRYYEIRYTLCRRSRQTAVAVGARRARLLLRRKLPKNQAARPLQVAVQAEPGWVHVAASVERVQNIALPEGREQGGRFDRGITASVHGGE